MQAAAVVLAMTAAMLVAPTQPSLALSQSHGLLAEPFTATYTGPLDTGRCLVTGLVNFTWDGRRLGTAPLVGCTASIRVTPPDALSGVGNHMVAGSATDPSGVTHIARAVYAIDPPVSPSLASPKPRTSSAKPPPVTASPAPTGLPPTQAQTPSPTVSPSQVDSGACEPDAAPGSGTLYPPGLTVIGVRSTSILPTEFAFNGPVAMSVLPGQSARDLQHAKEIGEVFACIRLNLGPGNGYLFANYALRSVAVRSVAFRHLHGDTGMRVDIELTYASVAWMYQSADGPVHAGTVTGPAFAPRRSGPDLRLLWGVGGLVVIGATATAWGLRRRRDG